MPLPPHAAEWMHLADLDYIGPFVKAWAAFNAWYREASAQGTERAMLDFVATQPNRARRRILPLLDGGNATADAMILKQAICDLHQCLDSIQFEVTRKGLVERVSLRSVCISPRPLQHQCLQRRRQEYLAKRVQGGGIEITVRSMVTEQEKFRHVQAQYDANEVYSLDSFTRGLSEAQRATFRAFYGSCNPRPMQDLVQGSGPSLAIATMQFRCRPEELFRGLIETIYVMRNALLHGEVDPDPHILASYEPAYRIVMQFLACIR